MLRMLAMMLILMLHANFIAIGIPGSEDILTSPISTSLRIGMQSACVVAVNVFVLISGWFGIRPSLSGIAKFLFQCTFCYFIAFLIFSITGNETFDITLFVKKLIFESGPIWFVISYIGLYILSPILNAYLAQTSQRGLKSVLIAFFTFQTLFGTFIPIVSFIDRGYSTFSFIGLYLLAFYLRHYRHDLLRHGFSIYIASIAILAVIAIVWRMLDIPNFVTLFYYSNPLVITGAAGLVMGFAGLKERKSELLNAVAVSTFAIYLLHCNPFLFDHYTGLIRDIYSHYNGFYFIAITLGVIAAVMTAAILIDRIRILCWKLIRRHAPRIRMVLQG